MTLIDALLADHIGDHTEAAASYRRALMTSAALSPASRLRAQVNLAVALEHADPAEASALSELALVTHEAEGLDLRMRPAILNVYGYTLLARGELDEAHSMFAQAEADARRDGNVRVTLFASFNDAIATELGGGGVAATATYGEVERLARGAGLCELALWASLRRAWGALRGGHLTACEHLIDEEIERVPSSLRDAHLTLQGLLSLARQDFGAARSKLNLALEAYLGKGDELTAFAVLLWLAHMYDQAGRPSIARSMLARAFALGRERGFRLSPNWWASDVVESARSLGDDRQQPFWSRLLAGRPPFRRAAQSPAAAVAADGTLMVGGRPISDFEWRRGHTGSFVLRRLLGSLAESYPAAVGRENLADLLWPDSDGDIAIRNLYAAISDLRRVLLATPGVRVISVDRSYALQVARNVQISRSRSPLPGREN